VILKLKTKLLILMLIFLPVVPSLAVLHLELTQGVDQAIPIAITSFVGEQANAPGNAAVSDIIKNDLRDSGQFRLISSKNTPANLAKINFKYWRKSGANDLLIGSVQNTGGDNYRVSFQLISVFKQSLAKAQANPASTLLLQQSFTTNQAGLRMLAHHISDLIYQQLTGVRGVFSTKIAYVLVQRRIGQRDTYKLEVADADGFNPQTLLISHQPIMSPAWSPDGKSIAYVSFENHQAQIYLQNLQTGQRQIISNYPGINGAPAFSPDGTKVALVLSSTGNPKIYVKNLTNGQVTQITRGYSIDTEPAWSLDGKNLLFTSNRGGTPQLYSYSFATGKTTRLTFTGNYNARGSFLPGNQDIIMMHRATGMFGIAHENLQTGQVTVLTSSGLDKSPSVAPNGKMILYATQSGGRGVLALVSTNGQIKLRLPAGDGSVQDPAWSPFLNS
jgi:TolB protein